MKYRYQMSEEEQEEADTTAARIIREWEGEFPRDITPFSLFDAYEDRCWEKGIDPAVNRWHLFDAYEDFLNAD